MQHESRYFPENDTKIEAFEDFFDIDIGHVKTPEYLVFENFGWSEKFSEKKIL